MLCLSVVVFIVLGVETVEDGSSKGKDGGSPRQAVAPVKLVVHPQRDRLDELDGEQNQAAHLQNRCGTETSTQDNVVEIESCSEYESNKETI